MLPSKEDVANLLKRMKAVEKRNLE